MVRRVEGSVAAWLAAGDNATRESAGFIYRSWLDAAAAIGGDRASKMVRGVEGRVAAWLDAGDNAIRESAHFVYKSWLDAAAAIGGDRASEMVRAIEGRVAAWLDAGDNAIRDGAGFICKSWLEAAQPPHLERFSTETIAWILAHQNGDHLDFVIESWLDRGLPFEPVREASFRAVRRLCDKPDATFILKHVVRQDDLPGDVVLAALQWCAGLPDHEDAINRLGPLVTFGKAELVDPELTVRVVARVLRHQSIDDIVLDRTKLVLARAILVQLFRIGVFLPRAEILARIYLVRWLRDGRLFSPRIEAAAIGPTLTFDQRIELPEALLTLLFLGEFVPADSEEDRAALEDFCDWVGRWEKYQAEIAGLVQELTEKFGVPDLWQRMLPAHQIAATSEEIPPQ